MQQFLRQLYVPYASDSGLPKLPAPETIYDAGLAALIRRDSAMMQKYEKGLIQEDPICVCQDWTALRVLKVSVHPKGPGMANATVWFADTGRQQRLGFQLVSVGGEWRIHDIRGGIAPSLRQYLVTGLAREEREIGKTAP